MGTVHKFKRPPKNQKQFQGYKPRPLQSPGGEKPQRLKLRGWQASAVAWLALLLVAVGIWAAGALLGGG